MSTQLIRTILKDVPIFKELTSEELESVVEISQSRFYKQKTLVFMQEQPLDRVFFIKSGKVKIYKTDVNGREQIVSILEPGEMFPHAGFFRKGTYPAYAEVMGDANFVVTPIADFEQVLITYPHLCIKIFNVLGEKIVDLQNRLQEQILNNTYEQIIMLLLRLCRTNGVKENEKYRLTTHFTNREMANMIGTSRETVSRTISQLKKNGVLQLNNEGLYIVDHKKLHEEIA